MMLLRSVVATSLYVVFATAAVAEVEIRRWNPKSLSQPDGYSQVVTVEGDYKTIYLGGKAGVRADGSIPQSLAEQSDLIFNNIRLALEDAGASPKDVVDIAIYIVDLANVDPNPVYDDVRKFFPAGHKPTSMVIGVSALAYPELLVEVSVTAVVSAGD